MKALLLVLQIIRAIGGLTASSSLQSQLPKNHEIGDETGLPPTGLSRDLLSSPIVNSANKGINSWRSSIESMQIIGSATNDTCGRQVANIGDFNNDGHADFAVGCHLTSRYNRINNGQVFVFFSRGERLDLTGLSNFAAGTNGFSITGASDYDELGRNGIAYLLFGKASNFADIDLSTFASGSDGFLLHGAFSGDLFGFSLSAASDVNGDKLADFLISAPNATFNGHAAAGVVYLMLGQASFSSDLDMANFVSGAAGVIVGDYLTYSTIVSSAGDLNRDGFADVLLGAPDVPLGGAVYALYGQAVFSADIDLSLVATAGVGFVITAATSDKTVAIGGAVAAAGD
eukprot:gene18955-21564_t